jgi:methionyl aminopeptidase
MDSTYKENFITAGKLAKEVRAYGLSLIVPGASYMEIYNKILTKIDSLNAKPAFPPQMALNDTAAHFLPAPGEDIVLSDELLSLDIGVLYNGAIGDCAGSIDLSGKSGDLILAAEACLKAAQDVLKVGLPIREIGQAIEEKAREFGFESVKNLSGHGLGEFKIHTDPSIPNYDNGDETLLTPGMTFAIEPFVTNGSGKIYDAGNPMIYSFVAKKPVRSPSSRSILKTIETFEGVPFSIHDIMRLSKEPLFKIKFALRELLSLDIIMGHAPLVEEKHGLVAQAENSVLIDDDGNVLISTL